MTSRQRLVALAACTTVGLGALTIVPATAHTLLHDETQSAVAGAASHAAAASPDQDRASEPQGRLGAAGKPGDENLQQPKLAAPKGEPKKKAPDTPGELTNEPATASATVAPGKSYAPEAEKYAYSAADVNAWLTDGTKAKNYPKDKIVFLTFDDGPTKQTEKDLKVLSDHGVHATFFQVGKQVGPKTAPIVKAVIAQGSAVAVHSYSHNYKSLYPGRHASAKNVGRDFDKAQAAFQKVLGKDYRSGAYRYPGGHMSWKGMKGADDALAERGATWVDWSTMNGDAEPKKRRPTSVEGMLRQVKKGSGSKKNPNVDVVLMHDARGKTLTTKALPEIIKHYKDAGYRFGIIG